MMTCVNKVLQNFLFSRDSSLEKQCPPRCEAFDFSLSQVMVSLYLSYYHIELLKRCKSTGSEKYTFVNNFYTLAKIYFLRFILMSK